jgi:predicted acetyltransferase
MATDESRTTTIQVRGSTIERLQALKIGGLSYDEVINLALDHFPEEELRKLHEAWVKEALAKLRRDPSVTQGKVSKRTA